MAKQAKKAAARKPAAKRATTRTTVRKTQASKSTPAAGTSAAQSRAPAARAAAPAPLRLDSRANPSELRTSADEGKPVADAAKLEPLAGATSSPQVLPATQSADEKYLTQQHLHGDTNQLGKIPQPVKGRHK